MRDLFDQIEPREVMAPGAILLRAFALPGDDAVLKAVTDVSAVAPFRHMTTPGGYRMSVAMTNCGNFGWVADRTGYRYSADDPETGLPWPAMPDVFSTLARTAAREAGYSDFEPDACLINRYEPGAKLSLHQDKKTISN